MRHSDALNEQLQTALNSRVVIEKAKGKLAERLGINMAQAFSLLRDYVRARNLRLADGAQAFIYGTEPLTATRPQQTPPGAAQARHQPRPGPRPRP
jgi:ANTAR domain